MDMISNWHYDAGEPYYVDALDKWTDGCRPCWWGIIYKKDIPEDNGVVDWLANNLKQYDIDFRFNRGNPCYFIKIYDEQEALTFWMVWGE